MSSEGVDALLDQFEACLRDVTTTLMEWQPKLAALDESQWSLSQKFRLCQIMAKFAENMGQSIEMKDIIRSLKELED